MEGTGPPGKSAVRGQADEIRQKGDIAVGKSAIGCTTDAFWRCRLKELDIQ